MRIIVIEDNELYKNELLRCLEQEESDIEIVGSASNGAEGLALTEKLIRDNLTPDVIFTDVRMPEMDGFEMIEALQRRGISCKIVVTSSCPEFLYAKRAMELGAVDFLVKPLKVYEVRNVLGRLRRELESEKKWKHILNLEYIFLNAMAGKIKDDQQIGDLIKEGYGIAPEERIGVLGIGMSSNYEKYKEQVLQMLKELEIFNQQQDFCAYTIEMYGRQSFVVLFYHMGNEHETYKYLEQTIVPMICNTVRGRVICTWAVSNGFGNMYEAVRELDHAAEWNLILKKGTLICKEKIQKIALYPYKYPVNLEKEAKEALLNKDAKRLKEIFSRYWDYCRELPCTPQEAKEGCIRIALVLIQMAAETGAVQAQRKGQTFLQRISRANGWTDVEEKVDTFFEYLTSKNEAENDMSLLVQKALENIREYYDQGITLEEIAEKLHVTEEYLSTQFRKETGRSCALNIRTRDSERIVPRNVESQHELASFVPIIVHINRVDKRVDDTPLILNIFYITPLERFEPIHDSLLRQEGLFHFLPGNLPFEVSAFFFQLLKTFLRCWCDNALLYCRHEVLDSLIGLLQSFL